MKRELSSDGRRRKQPLTRQATREIWNRRLLFEPLEDRRLLTFTNLAAIDGTLFYDLLGDVRRPIADQPIRLHQDGNGNGLYDGASTDPLRETCLTNADGQYRFEMLTAGTYFVVQPDEPSGQLQPPPEPVVRTIIVTPADARGTAGVQIDEFDDPQSLTAQRAPLGVDTVHSQVPSLSALGGQRKVVVHAISGDGKVNVEIDEAGVRRFSYSENVSTSGNARVAWDGSAGDPTVVNPTGLGGVDLTGGGLQDSLVLNIHSTQLPPVQTVVVYTDATHASFLTRTAPAFTIGWGQRLMFNDFSPLPGFAAADFTSVGAIEFHIHKDPAYPDFALDYDLDRIDTIGPTVLHTDLPFAVASGIGLVKRTNDTDNDTAPGLLLPVGSEVTWSYLVTNQGNESIAAVVVTDDQLGPGEQPLPILVNGLNAGDADGDGLLDPGEAWLFTATGAAIAGPYANLGSVTGVGVFSGVPLRAENSDHYYGAQPAIDIEKATNGDDADTPTGPVLEVKATGTTVTWTYVVTNPGNVPLANVVVTDDNGTPGHPADDFQPDFMGGDTNGNGLLDLDETWQYQAIGWARVGLYGNAATATAVDPIGQIVDDMDPSHYFGFQAKVAPSPAPILVLGPDKNPGTPQAILVLDGQTLVLPEFGFVAYEDSYVGGTRVAVADLDGDGRNEIITAPGRNRAPEVRIFTPEGHSVPGFPGFLAYRASYTGGVELTVADVNGDGKPDIITVPGYGAAEVRVFFNRYDSQDPEKPAFQADPDVVFQAFEVAAVGGAVVAAADMGSWDGSRFVNATDGKAEIIVGTGVGQKATVAVFEVTGANRTPVRTFYPFTAENPNFQGGVSLDVAWIDKDSSPQQAPPDILVGMGVNGTSRIEVWAWDTFDARLFLRGAIPQAFTGPSNNAPVRVAALDTDGNGIAETLFAVQGPIGTSGQIQGFDITGTSPFLYQQAPPLSGFSGPWFIATGKKGASGTGSPGPFFNAPPAELVWTNTVNAYDVNNDGKVTPLDALETINYINTHPGETALPAEQFSPPRFFDCNVDGAITSADVLFVVNSFNRSSPYSGEGEPSEPRGEIGEMFSLPAAAGRLAEFHDPPSMGCNRGPGQAPDAVGLASVSGLAWAALEVELPPSPVPPSSQSPLGHFSLLELETVLEDLAAELAAS
jgi:hypothetical protein